MHVLAGHVARMTTTRNVYRILVEKLEGKNQLGDLGIDGRILIYIFVK
jgi:hypothetical protein